MSRGSVTAVTVGDSWQTIFSAAADGPATAMGIDTEGAGGRVSVRYTTLRGRVNFLTIKANDYKAFRTGKNQLALVEVRSDSAGTIYSDMLASDDA